MKNSKLPAAYCKETFEKYKTESDEEDNKILNKISELTDCINESNKQSKEYH